VPYMLSADSTLSDQVNIYLWNATDGSKLLIANGIDDTLGYHSWTIPDTITPDRRYKVRIENGDSSKYFMISEDYFKIYEDEEAASVPLVSNKVQTQPQAVNSVQLFPNPNGGTFTLKSTLAPMRNIEIISMRGEQVLRLQELNLSEYTLSQQQLPAGSYVALITDTHGNRQSVKFVVER